VVGEIEIGDALAHEVRDDRGGDVPGIKNHGACGHAGFHTS